MESSATKRKFALKRITCHSIEDQNIAMREVELTRSVKHPNIVEIIDYELKGDADIVINTMSHMYVLFPFFKHGSLHDHLNMRAKQDDHMSESQVLQIFVGICEGLKALHEAKPEPLAHRDLKTGKLLFRTLSMFLLNAFIISANICLSDSMEPILVDFGSCTEAREQICGQTDAQRLQDWAEERCSIVYRAPELFNVQTYCMIDERTDIWSLGCVLYAICFFKCPYDIIYEKGDSVALAVLSGNIIFPESSPFSEDMHNLISFMLRINPMERPYIYSVLEAAQSLISKLESRV